MRRAALLLVVLCACHPTIDFDLTQSGTVDIPGGGPAGVPLALTLPLPGLQNVDTSRAPERRRSP